MGPSVCVILSTFEGKLAQSFFKDLYYTAFPNDRRILKSIVFTMLLLETVQTVVLSQDTIRDFIIGFTDPSAFNAIDKAWFSIPLMTGMSAYVYFRGKFKTLLTKSVPCAK